MYEIIDDQAYRLEWRGASLFLVVDDEEEVEVDPWDVLQRLRQYARRPDAESPAAVVVDGQLA